MAWTMKWRQLWRDRVLGSRQIPLRTRLMMATSGAMVGLSFGFLAAKLSRRMSPGAEWVPWVVATIGIAGVILLQRVLRAQILVNLERQKDDRAAEQIQTRLRPEQLPQPPGYEVAGFYRAYRHVGGDYYEVMLLDEKRLMVTIADVSGKGAAAALLTANLQAILKFVDLDEQPLDRITAAINVHLCRHSESSRFITLWMGVLDLESRRLTYVNAGHNPAMLHRDGRIERFEATAPPLGAIEGLTFAALETTMAPGDALVLYTDGLSERRNRANRFFDEAGIERTLATLRGASADAIVQGLIRANETFSEGVPPDDDTAIVVVRAVDNA